MVGLREGDRTLRAPRAGLPRFIRFCFVRAPTPCMIRARFAPPCEESRTEAYPTDICATRIHGDFAQTAEPDIVFNYLGDFQWDGLLQFAPEIIHNTRDPAGQRSHILEINAYISAGALRVHWHYSRNLHASKTLEKLNGEFAGALDQVIAAEMERLRDDAFPLSPTQTGMLMESVLSSAGDMHVEQIQATLRGPLHGDALERAWAAVLDENAALRGGFRWDQIQEPRQFIAAKPRLPLQREDFRGKSPEALQEFLRATREAGFDFERPPLMRVALLQTDGDEHLLVWTFHHILMDGWCLFPVLKRVFAVYEALLENRSTPPIEAPAYREYIDWLDRRDTAEPAEFFAEKLSGFSRASLPGRASSGSIEGKSGVGRRDLTLDPSTRNRLETFARENRLTMNTIMQGLWALALARYNQSSDVTFGVTVSGRPPEMAGVEHTIGLFINTLPVRARVNDDDDVLRLFRAIQDYNLELREYEYSAGADLRAWSGLPAGTPLFESILVYENYPFEPESFEAAGLQFDMTTLESAGAVTAYALTLLVIPGRDFAIRAIHDAGRMTTHDADLILNHLHKLMETLIDSPGAKVGEFPAPTEEHELPFVRTPERTAFAAPRGETEEKLAGLFRDILGVEEVGRHDGFFELGGQSVSALRLAAGIRALFKREIRVSLLASGGSIADLAPLLESPPEDESPGSESRDAVLVPIQVRGTRPPLFLVHPAGASPLCYAVLARGLGPDQPVHGLQPRGLEDDEPFLTNIEDMAAHYIRRIREIDPHGPYRLGGWSLGGIIAYEMAVQLHAAGREVDFLGMIDVTVEDHGDFHPWLFVKAAAFAMKSILEQDLPRDWHEWRHLLNFVGVDLPEDPLKIITDARLPDPGEWKDALFHLTRVLSRFYPIYIINMIAPMQYKPRTWSGRADLFRVEPYFWEKPDPLERKLREYARGGVRVHPIAGNHMTLMSLNNAPVLAEALRRRLDEIDD